MRRRVVLAVAALTALLLVPVSYAAFSAKTTTPASFGAASSFPTYPQQTLTNGAQLYHRGDESPSAAAAPVAADSSGNGLNGVYNGATDGPSSHWAFDEGSNTLLADTGGSGNTMAAYNGPAWVPGQVGSAGLSFDGTDDWGGANAPSVDTGDSFTVSAWAYLTDLTANRTVAAQDGNWFSGFYLMYESGSKTWMARTYAADTPFVATTQVIASSPAIANRWTHLAIVYDDPNDLLMLYVDGQLQGSTAKTTDWVAAGGFTVGASRFGLNDRSGYFKGQIDDVYAFRRPLTSAEVGQLYGRPRTDWTFDTPVASQSDASYYNNTGTIGGSPTYSGSGVVMDGDDFVSGTAAAMHTDRSFSVAAWAQPSAATGTRTLISQAGSSTSSFALASTGGYWTFTVAASDVTSPVSVTITSVTPATAGTLAHVAGVFNSDSNTVFLYVNGRLEARQNVTGVFDAGGVFTVGRQVSAATSTGYFAGRIDDVRAYDHVLTSADVYSLYGQPTARYDFTQNSPAASVDSSGGAYTATRTAGTTGWLATGHRGGSLTLSGSGFQSTAAAVVDTSNSYTVAAWVLLSAAGAGNQTILSQDATTTSAFALRYLGSTGKWSFAEQPADSTATANAVSSGASAVAGRWTFLTAVYNDPSDTVTLYVNGANAASAPATADFVSAGPLVIGASKFGGSRGDYFTGSLDQVVAYPVAMVAADVSTLYKQDQSMQWDFNENTGTTLGDRSGNNNSGTLVNSPAWATGVSGSALSFDGTSNSSVTSATAPVDTGGSFTVSAWVYLNGVGNNKAVVSQNGASAARYYLGFSNTASKWVFTMAATDAASPTLVTVTSSVSAVNTTWTLLTGVYDNDLHTMSLYVNGVLSGTAGMTANWTAGVLAVGYRLTGGGAGLQFKGTIDELTTFGYALSDYAVRALAGFGGTEALPWQIHVGTLALGLPGALQGSQQGQTSSTAVGFTGRSVLSTGKSYTSPDTFTVEMWFRLGAYAGGGGLAGFSTDQTSMSTTADRLLYVNTSGNVVFGVAPGGVKRYVTSAGTYADGGWHYVAASLGPAGMRLYVDQSVATNAAYTSGLAATGWFRFGGVNLAGWAAAPAYQSMYGTLDEMAVYPAQLTDNQIARHYASNH